MLKRLAVVLILGILLFFVSQAYAKTVVVPCPSGDSSAAILAALFEARNGGTVQLQEGTYYLFNPIVVDFAFKGVLGGAGKDKTIITTDPNYPIGPVSFSWSSSLPPEDMWLLIWFNIPVGQQGSIALSDLSINVPYAEVSTAPDTGLLGFVIVNGTKVDTYFDRLRIKGGPGNLDGFNSWYGIVVFSLGDQDLMTGNHYLRNCEFDTVFDPYDPVHIQNGTLIATNNSLHDFAWGLDYEGLSNCSVEVSRNQLSKIKWTHAISVLSYSILPDYPVAPLLSRYVITNNSIKPKFLLPI